MKTQHTPGPWSYEFHPNGGITIFTIDDDPSVCRSICTTFMGNEKRNYQQTEDIANARLIAAAPEMLEMLYQCRAYIPVVDRPKGLDAVIAKAEGGLK